MHPTATTLSGGAIQLKRAYDPADTDDGQRILVDRLWTRGISKQEARLDARMKELGPSSELREPTTQINGSRSSPPEPSALAEWTPPPVSGRHVAASCSPGMSRQPTRGLRLQKDSI